MKIVYAGNIVRGLSCIERMQALKDLGHEVIEFNFTDFNVSRIWAKIQFNLGFGPGINQLNKAFFNVVISEKPDLVWVDKGIYLQPDSLASIKSETDAKIIHLNPDDPFGGKHRRGWRLFKKGIPRYDLHFVPRPQNINEYKAYGANEVVEYDRSFNAKLHKPIALSDEELAKFAIEVGFIGSFAIDRAKSLHYLIKNNIPVSIYGDGWQKYKHWGEIKHHYRSPGLYGEDYAKAINGMKIALHFLRKENRDFQDSRTYEIPACGTFMLAERTSKHEELFKEDYEAVFFDSDEDLLQKIKYYLEHTTQRLEIARRGTLKSYTSGFDHKSRMCALLDVIHEKFSNIPA